MSKEIKDVKFCPYSCNGVSRKPRLGPVVPLKQKRGCHFLPLGAMDLAKLEAGDRETMRRLLLKQIPSIFHSFLPPFSPSRAGIPSKSKKLESPTTNERPFSGTSQLPIKKKQIHCTDIKGAIERLLKHQNLT